MQYQRSSPQPAHGEAESWKGSSSYSSSNYAGCDTATAPLLYLLWVYSEPCFPKQPEPVNSRTDEKLDHKVELSCFCCGVKIWIPAFSVFWSSPGFASWWDFTLHHSTPLFSALESWIKVGVRIQAACNLTYQAKILYHQRVLLPC